MAIAASSVPPFALGTWARVLRRATVNFVEDRCTHMAAAISYFALFSIFPLVALAISVFGIVLRDPDVQANVVEAIVGAIPIDTPDIQESLRDLAKLGPTLTIVALFGTLWTASALTTAVQRSLNVVFDVDRSRPALRGKAIDYLVLSLLGLLFLASFAATAAWRVVQAQTDARIGLFTGQLSWVWEVGTIAIPAAGTFATFLFLYWLLPNRPVRLREIWPGALVATIAFEVVKFGFAVYLANFANYQAVYGSLGGVIALLFWVYISANIFLFGAEIAAEAPHVLHEEPRHGHARGAAGEGEWRRSLWLLLRGLVLAPGEQAGPAAPVHAEDAEEDPDADDAVA